MTDFCGQIGSIYTNIIFPVSTLSTISYNVAIGTPIVSDKIDPEGGITKALDTADLACPTWGIETPNGGLLGFTVGPPFLPIIVPPPELLSFDSLWASCSYVGVANFIISYGIFDPPRILTPQAYLTPPPTAAPESSTKPSTRELNTQDRASPGSRDSPRLPSKTVGSTATETAPILIDPSSTFFTDRGAHDPKIFVPSKTAINLGGIIYSAFGAGNLSPTIIGDASQTKTSVNPSVIAIEGKTLVASTETAKVLSEVTFLDPSELHFMVINPP